MEFIGVNLFFNLHTHPPNWCTPKGTSNGQNIELKTKYWVEDIEQHSRRLKALSHLGS